MSANSSWVEIRKSFFKQIRNQVFNRLGKESIMLQNYRSEYEKEFKKKWELSSKGELIDEILRSDVVFVGDFHASHQSQRTHFRLLQSLIGKKDIILAVEFLEKEHQNIINSYLLGKISEKQFLSKIQWKKRWNYPWAHYKVIMDWAKENDIQVFGLNRYFSSKNEQVLYKRDRFSAEAIKSIVDQNPESLVFVVYGDLHIAKDHLPGKLSNILKSRPKKRILRIYQNSEKIYFQLAQRGIETKANVLKLSSNSYCLMSIPPWVKWQSYLMYIEKNIDSLIEDEEEQLDYTDFVSNYVKLISHALNLKIDLSHLSVYSPQDDYFWKVINEEFLPKDLKIIKQMIAEGMSFYIPEKSIAYLSKGSINSAAALAMDYIHGQISKRTKTVMSLPEDFTKAIWLQSVQYFGSKIINHNRKTDTIADIKAQLSSKFPQDKGREAMLIALGQKMKEWLVVQNKSAQRAFHLPKSSSTYREAAKILGGIMGERLYNGYQSGVIQKAMLNQWLAKNIEIPQFEAFYYEMIEVIDSLPINFDSKNEVL